MCNTSKILVLLLFFSFCLVQAQSLELKFINQKTSDTLEVFTLCEGITLSKDTTSILCEFKNQNSIFSNTLKIKAKSTGKHILSVNDIMYHKLDTSLMLKKGKNIFYIHLQPKDSVVLLVKSGKQNAIEDIQNKKIFLYRQGGIVAPPLTTQDKSFQLNFNLKYIATGCTGPSKDYTVNYNKEVFKYLNKQFGNTWKSNIRKDTFGI
tara:strand:+ start:476 stop:1096 length:621 start_codon:yes stop_codon:yes gene_type:complete